MAKMKLHTQVVEIKHQGEVITVKGPEAGVILSKLSQVRGTEKVFLEYTNEQGELTGFTFCCGDTWTRKANEVKEVDVKDSGLDCADEKYLGGK